MNRMEEDRKKGELPQEDQDVPQVTGQGDFDNVGQKGGDVSGEDRGQQDSSKMAEVNNLSGQDRDIAQGKDQKKEELR